MKTWVEFYNNKEDVYIKIPMYYDNNTECLSVEQRCLAYEKLSEIVSDDFIHNTVIASAEDEKMKVKFNWEVD